MKESLSKKRNLWVILGIVALVAERLVAAASWEVVSWDLAVFLSYLSWGLWAFAIGALLYGCYCWAKYKGRSGWFCLLGLLGPIGFIPLAIMKDKFEEVASKQWYARLVKDSGDTIVGPFSSKKELLNWYDNKDDWEGIKEIRIGREVGVVDER